MTSTKHAKENTIIAVHRSDMNEALDFLQQRSFNPHRKISFAFTYPIPEGGAATASLSVPLALLKSDDPNCPLLAVEYQHLRNRVPAIFLDPNDAMIRDLSPTCRASFPI